MNEFIIKDIWNFKYFALFYSNNLLGFLIILHMRKITFFLTKGSTLRDKIIDNLLDVK